MLMAIFFCKCEFCFTLLSAFLLQTVRVFDFSPWHSLPFVSHNEGRVPPPVFASSEHQLYKKCQSFMFIKINFTCRSVLLLAFSLLCSNIGTLFFVKGGGFASSWTPVWRSQSKTTKGDFLSFLCVWMNLLSNHQLHHSHPPARLHRGAFVCGDGSPDKEGTCSLLSTQECL